MGQHQSGGTDGYTGLGDRQHCVRESGYTVHEMPEGSRPREFADRVGVGNVPDAMLVALLLRGGTARANVVDIAEGLIRRFGSLGGLAGASPADLQRIPGIGPVKAQQLEAAMEFGRRVQEQVKPSTAVVRSPADVYALLGERAAGMSHERFWVLPLDSRNRLKSQPVLVSQGLLNASLVHPREVFSEPLMVRSAAVVLAHNHPSGDTTPSAEDLAITRQLVEAGKLLDLRVLDHVILGRGSNGEPAFLSLREAGLAKFG
jgi:DNA repair protein RadC